MPLVLGVKVTRTSSQNEEFWQTLDVGNIFWPMFQIGFNSRMGFQLGE
jgi:hypothetical protein